MNTSGGSHSTRANIAGIANQIATTFRQSWVLRRCMNFVTYCSEKGYTPASLWVYRKRFNEYHSLPLAGEYAIFALTLKNAVVPSLTAPTRRPRSNTWKTCDSMNVKTDAESDTSTKTQLMVQWELHKRKAERAYQELKEDTAWAKMSVVLDVFTFDLEQALPTAMLYTHICRFFRKRQSWHSWLQVRQRFHVHVGRVSGFKGVTKNQILSP